MAPATTSPIKILTDLGYEVWEIESDADMIRALIEAINTLTVTNSSDGRIPILVEALTALRGKRKKESPSRGMKATEKRTTLKGSKFIPRAKPKAKANPVAMLPVAQDDNAPIFGTLLNGLKGIASLLKNIALLLSVQFRFKRLLAARQSKADALEAKRKREEGLEGSEKSGIRSGILSSIAKPVKSFWDTLLNFFKNIILGSALLGFYKWMKDPKNLETIKGIGEWFDKYGKSVLITLGALLALDIGFKAYRLVRGIRNIVRALKLGEFFRRPWWKKPLDKATQKTLTSKGVAEGTEKGLQKGVNALNAIENARLLKEEQLLKAGREITRVIPQEIVEGGIQGQSFLQGSAKAIKKLFTSVGSEVPAGGGSGGIGAARQAVSEGGKKISKKITKKFIEKGGEKVSTAGFAAASKLFTVKGSLLNVPKEVIEKGATKISGMAGMDILKLIGDEKALKKLLDNGTITKEVYDNLIKQGIENPVLGKAIGEGVASKLINPEVLEPISKEAMKKLGPWGWLKRSLAIISTGLDAWSAIEELQKGNLQAALLFTGGAVTSMVAPWWSFGLSMAGVAESIRADRAKEADPNYEDPLGKYLKNIKFAPHMVTPQMMDFYSTNPTSKKRNVNVVLAPTDTGDGSTTSGSGATNSDITAVASFDTNNPQLLGISAEYEVLGAYS